MKEQILKAVAQQPKLFLAPMLPAVLNFALQMAILTILQAAFPSKINPIVFMFNFLVVHVILIVLGQKEPCLSKIIQSIGSIKSNWKPDGKLDKTKLAIVRKDIPMNTENYSNLIQINGGLLTAAIQFKIPNGVSVDDTAILWNNLFLTCQDNALPFRIFQDNYHEYSYLYISAHKSRVTDLNRAIFHCMKALQQFGAILLSDTETERLIQDMIPGEIIFDKTNDMFRFDNGRMYGAYVGITHLGHELDTQMLQDILALRYQIKIQHNICPIPSTRANPLLIQQRKMAFFSTFSQNVYNQYTEALGTISANQQILTSYALNFFVSGRSASEVEQGVKEIISVLSHYHFMAKKEGPVARETFLNQFLPFNIYPRERYFLSGTVATALSVPNIQNNSSTQWGTRW